MTWPMGRSKINYLYVQLDTSCLYNNNYKTGRMQNNDQERTLEKE